MKRLLRTLGCFRTLLLLAIGISGAARAADQATFLVWYVSWSIS
jgi:hypothetical protein